MTLGDVKVSGSDERFSRFRLIHWWNQDVLSRARILVIGAGALGNEIIKNLALLGIGHIFIADLDTVEHPNLSRSILFRSDDNGQEKARVAAESAGEIYPHLHTRWFCGNVIYDLGMGVFRWADVVIVGLDNREARLHVNRHCWRTGTPWIDGAIEALNGVARVFIPPGSSCYECTMNETDWKELQSRRSCNLLSRDEMELGHVPTTPTISSIIAGVQCQELIKLLHGFETLKGQGFVFNGMTADSYIVDYPVKEDCLSHEVYDVIEETEWGAATTTLGQTLSFVREKLGEGAVLEFNNDILREFSCPGCQAAEKVFKSLGRVTLAESRCSRCGELRVPHFTHTIDGTEDFLSMTLQEVGVPPFDILTGRKGMSQVFFELSADRQEVLAQLADQAGA